jgi:hypothetical protein
MMLEDLMLHGNLFSGDFPAKIWSLPKLRRVMIQDNRFTGTLPAEISVTIIRIEIRNNMFSGFIP